MEYIKNHDKYLDPPDEPNYGFCYGCGEIYDFDDLTEIHFEWFCKDCAREYIKKFNENDWDTENKL